MMQLRSVRRFLVLSAFLCSFVVGDAFAVPDLEPFTPPGWSGPVVVSNVTGTNTNSSPLFATDTLRVDWAIINVGTSATNIGFQLRVDGVAFANFNFAGTLDQNFFVSLQDVVVGPRSAGVHTISIVADSSNTIAESNEGNNIFTNTFTIGEVGDPEIRIDPLDVTIGAVPPSSTTVFGTTDYATTGLVGRDESKELLVKAHAEGSVRVIARLDVAFAPEGLLGASARAAQRAGIASRQAEVLAALRLPEKAVKRFATIPFLAMEVSSEQLARLSSMPGVREVAEDRLHAPTMASSNGVIGSSVAWDAGFAGAGQAVAVLDTGVDTSHPFFTTFSKIVSEGCFSSTTASSTSVCPGGVSTSTASGSGVNCPTAVVEGCFHGTHVAGTVAGNDGIGPNFGVARDADIIAMQVFSQFTGANCGVGPSPCVLSFTSDQILALERVLTLSATIDIAAVNMSLGGGQFFSQATCDSSNTAMKAAIDNLRAVGIATVIASGNNGFKTSMGAPACVSTAVSVGATDDSDSVASFSNIASFVSLVAPGFDITSAVPGGGVSVSQGTSMATPHAAGAWAILKQAQPAAAVTDILNLLRDTARNRSDLRAGGSITGLRRINIGEALLTATNDGFTIFNEGIVTLNVSGITPATTAPWIASVPTTPFSVVPGGSRFVTVDVNMLQAPAGSTTTRLNVTSNDADESPYPDGVDITVHNGAAASATVTIVATDNSATESPNTTGLFTVTRTGSTGAALTVNYTVGGTATSGADFTALPGSVTIAIGQASATITLTAVDDALVEVEETVIVTLAAGTGYTAGVPATGTVTITSEDLPAPANFVATASSPAAIALSWNAVAGAASYRVYRSTNRVSFSLVGSPVSNSFTHTTSLDPNTAYVYKVRAFGVSESADSNIDVATTAVITTDLTITPDVTAVKAAHWTELVPAVNSLRTLAGLPAFSFATSPVAGGSILVQTVLGLRTALDQARTICLVPAAAYADPSLAAGGEVRAQHLLDLRAFSR
jgi:hypothetical protein